MNKLTLILVALLANACAVDAKPKAESAIDCQAYAADYAAGYYQFHGSDDNGAQVYAEVLEMCLADTGWGPMTLDAARALKASLEGKCTGTETFSGGPLLEQMPGTQDFYVFCPGY